MKTSAAERDKIAAGVSEAIRLVIAEHQAVSTGMECTVQHSDDGFTKVRVSVDYVIGDTLIG